MFRVGRKSKLNHNTYRLKQLFQTYFSTGMTAQDMAQKGFQTLPIESQAEPRIGRHQPSCGGCKTLNCNYIHGPVAKNCFMTGCYFCSELATLDNEISDAYDCLLKLVKKRAQIVKKTNHAPYIHRLPVELLSLIFIFVKKGYDDRVGKPSLSLPRSPPLCVGSVCKNWRDITLRTPQLWTDIFVDLMMPVDAQLNMINKSAHRSGALPLNLAIFSLQHLSIDHEQAALREWDGVAKALRSLVLRWNEVALQAPWSICYKLLDQLEECPSITSFYALFSMPHGVNPIKLQHPLRPKYFYSWDISREHIPVKWDDLVHLETWSIAPRELLHIIHYAQKLRHFAVESIWGEEIVPTVPLSIPTTPITNHSLIHFKTKNDVFDYLTLPSLQYLDYSIIESAHNIDSFLDSVVSFLDRSRAPLQTFLLECDIKNVYIALSLEKLPLITSLTIDFRGQESDRIEHTLQALTRPYTPVILPHPQQFGITTHSMGSSSWSLFSRLFRNDIQLETPGLQYMKDSVTLGRPLSKISLRLSHEFRDAEPMDKTTFLHLLAVRKSGVELDIVTGWSQDDAFPALAKFYNVKL